MTYKIRHTDPGFSLSPFVVVNNYGTIVYGPATLADCRQWVSDNVR